MSFEIIEESDGKRTLNTFFIDDLNLIVYVKRYINPLSHELNVYCCFSEKIILNITSLDHRYEYHDYDVNQQIFTIVSNFDNGNYADMEKNSDKVFYTYDLDGNLIGTTTKVESSSRKLDLHFLSKTILPNICLYKNKFSFDSSKDNFYLVNKQTNKTVKDFSELLEENNYQFSTNGKVVYFCKSYSSRTDDISIAKYDIEKDVFQWINIKTVNKSNISLIHTLDNSCLIYSSNYAYYHFSNSKEITHLIGNEDHIISFVKDNKLETTFGGLFLTKNTSKYLEFSNKGKTLLNIDLNVDVREYLNNKNYHISYPYLIGRGQKKKVWLYNLKTKTNVGVFDIEPHIEIINFSKYGLCHCTQNTKNGVINTLGLFSRVDSTLNICSFKDTLDIKFRKKPSRKTKRRKTDWSKFHNLDITNIDSIPTNFWKNYLKKIHKNLIKNEFEESEELQFFRKLKIEDIQKFEQLTELNLDKDLVHFLTQHMAGFELGWIDHSHDKFWAGGMENGFLCCHNTDLLGNYEALQDYVFSFEEYDAKDSNYNFIKKCIPLGLGIYNGFHAIVLNLEKSPHEVIYLHPISGAYNLEDSTIIEANGFYAFLEKWFKLHLLEIGDGSSFINKNSIDLKKPEIVQWLNQLNNMN